MQEDNSQQKKLDDGVVDEAHQIEAPKGFRFYWGKIKKLVLVFLGLEILVLILDLIKGLEIITQEILPSLIFIAEILVILILVIKLLIKRNIKAAFVTAILFSLITGVLAAVLRVLWHFESWTILNLFLEPAILIFWALIIWFAGWVIYLIVNKIQSVIFYNKNKVKSDLNI